MSKKPVSQPLWRRSSRSIPAIITALILLTLAVLSIWASIAYLVKGSWPTFISEASNALTSLNWNSPGTWAASVGVALLGLFLLLAGVVPGPRTTVRIDSPERSNDSITETVMSRRGLARMAGARVDQTDGVVSSSIKATATAVDVQAATNLRRPRELSAELKQSLTRECQAMGLSPVPEVRVSVRTAN